MHCVDKRLDCSWFVIWVHAVSQIDDVALFSKFIEHLLHLCANYIVWCKQNARVEITLNNQRRIFSMEKTLISLLETHTDIMASAEGSGLKFTFAFEWVSTSMNACCKNWWRRGVCGAEWACPDDARNQLSMSVYGNLPFINSVTYALLELHLALLSSCTTLLILWNTRSQLTH